MLGSRWKKRTLKLESTVLCMIRQHRNYAEKWRENTIKLKHAGEAERKKMKKESKTRQKWFLLKHSNEMTWWKIYHVHNDEISIILNRKTPSRVECVATSENCLPLSCVMCTYEWILKASYVIVWMCAVSQSVSLIIIIVLLCAHSLAHSRCLLIFYFVLFFFRYFPQFFSLSLTLSHFCVPCFYVENWKRRT